jgi:uncharacterized membrane protein
VIPEIINHIFRGSGHTDRKILLLISIVTVALLVDTSLNKISDVSGVTNSQSSLNWIMAVFIVVIMISIVGQHLVLDSVKQKRKEITTQQKPHLNALDKIMAIFQYALSAILVVVVIQYL